MLNWSKVIDKDIFRILHQGSHQSFSGQWVRSSVAGRGGASVSLQAKGAGGGGGQGRGVTSGTARGLWGLVQKVTWAAFPICSKACCERLRPCHIVTKNMSRDKHNNLTENKRMERQLKYYLVLVAQIRSWEWMWCIWETLSWNRNIRQLECVTNNTLYCNALYCTVYEQCNKP